MTRYTDMKNLPGPGDEETWGPCTGHPLDPRTPDMHYTDDQIGEKQFDMTLERLRESPAWVIEAFTEYTDSAPFEKIRQGILQDNQGTVMEGVWDLLEAYVMPSEDEAAQAMDEEADDGY